MPSPDGHVRLILHGAKPLPPGLREEIAHLREQGVHLNVSLTFESGDADRLTREALALGATHIVAGGGDGTIHQVTRALLEAKGEASLGVLPLGTGNDLARALELPLETPPEALRIAIESEAIPVDVIRLGERSFLNMATLGFGTRMTLETDPEMKKWIGNAAYFLTGLTHPEWLAAQRARVRGPDFSWEGSFLALALGNGRSAGGGVPFCPTASVNDGLLDLAILRYDEEKGLLEPLRRILEEGGEFEGTIQRAQAPWFEIEPLNPIPLGVNLDGEPWELPEGPSRFEVEPGALRMHIPTTSSALSKG